MFLRKKLNTKSGLEAVIVGLMCLASTTHAIAAGNDLSVDSFSDVKTGMRNARAIPVDSAAGDAPSVGSPNKPVEFVVINGGTFSMGADYAQPHEVTIKTFEMSKTLVTVEQYAECVINGACTAPDTTGDTCNWGKAHRQSDPINCVDWEQANQFAAFEGARLPSEAEYEYAAKNGGKNQRYPWGNLEATCDKAAIERRGTDNGGCGGWGTMPVCSKPAGNTAQGLCDMVGNVSEWMQDTSHASYVDAPTDGSAWEGTKSFDIRTRMVRGGDWSDSLTWADRHGMSNDIADRRDNLGIRLARER
jgi:formylglycine-generating enzyme required for sulfatase activity